MNYIIRAVYNRPEMLCFSMEYEKKAREYYCNDEYKTLFCVEHGASPIIETLIESYYPFEYEIVKRKFRHFGWGNILEGLNAASEKVDSYMLNLEDDCLIHPTYFKYIDEAVSLVDDKCSVINASNRAAPGRDKDAVNVVNKTRLFEATCCLIFKDFYNRYVKPYATYDYYKHRERTIRAINNRNNGNPLSKFRSERNNLMTHIGWDGLVNRLVDTAAIEEGMYCISPQADRRIHIGFYGQNRPGKFPPEYKTFESRINFLADIISNSGLLAKLDGRYNDYDFFSKNLDTWNGILTIK